MVERYDDFQITREPSEFLEAQIYNGGFYSSSDKERISFLKVVIIQKKSMQYQKNFKIVD